MIFGAWAVYWYPCELWESIKPTSCVSVANKCCNQQYFWVWKWDYAEVALSNECRLSLHKRLFCILQLCAFLGKGRHPSWELLCTLLLCRPDMLLPYSNDTTCISNAALHPQDISCSHAVQMVPVYCAFIYTSATLFSEPYTSVSLWS